MSRGATAQLALSGVLRGSALYLGGICAEVLNSSRQRRQKKKNGFQKKKNKTHSLCDRGADKSLTAEITIPGTVQKANGGLTFPGAGGGISEK